MSDPRLIIQVLGLKGEESSIANDCQEKKRLLLGMSPLTGLPMASDKV